MPNLNLCQLMGNLTRDPEVKFTPKGTAIVDFGLAINRNYTTEAGEKRSEVTFVDIEFWGKQAETIGEYVKKGDPLYIHGRLKLDQWDDKTTGQKRSKLRVIGESFQFLKSKGDGETTSRHADEADAQASRQYKKPAPKKVDPSDAPLDDVDDSDEVPF